jgi:hypothetical protein
MISGAAGLDLTAAMQCSGAPTGLNVSKQTQSSKNFAISRSPAQEGASVRVAPRGCSLRVFAEQLH